MTDEQYLRTPWRKSTYSSGSEGQCVEVMAFWRKSSYSSGSGGQCVEVAAMWRKSSHSGSGGRECVEIAALPVGRMVGMRDSKNPDGPVLSFTPAEWSTFLGGVRRDAFGSLTHG